MTFRAICVVLLLSILPAAGCGTVANVARQRPGDGGVVPFGGVHHDLWCIRKAAAGEFGLKNHHKAEPDLYPQVGLMLFCATDLPLSLVGDCLTWPYTAAYTFINEPLPPPPVEVMSPLVAQPIPTPPATLPQPNPTPPETQPKAKPIPTPPETQPKPIPVPPVKQPNG
jgi:hypothetical protein